ncbi:hypothetical protein AMTRI_Chr03g53660 [Amborella trichopoda]
MEENTERGAHIPSPPPSEQLDVSTTIDPSYIIYLIRQLLPQDKRLKNGSQGLSTHQNSNEEPQSYHSMNVDDGNKHEVEQNEPTEMQHDGLKYPVPAAKEDSWEEYGCILWDLAANQAHAELMVQNLLVDVLLASLSVATSARMTEIFLGIMANLACHDVPRNVMVSTEGLIEKVLEQLFLDDCPSLSETCRLLVVCLQSSRAIKWINALESEPILQRLLWITGNTLNSQLLEKCVELLLAIADSQIAKPILLPPLLRLGLPDILADLLACEINKISEGKLYDRDTILDLILQVCEALSVVQNYSEMLCSNKKLFQLACDVIKLPDIDEVARSRVTAVVLIANLLSDGPNRVAEISHDLPFLQGLLDLLPSVSDDSQARHALWSVLARILVKVQDADMGSLYLRQYASVLMRKSDVIIEDIIDHNREGEGWECGSNGFTSGPNAKTKSVDSMLNIFDAWINSSASAREQDLTKDVERAHKLLRSCMEEQQ